MDEHPGVVFGDGRTGRRVVLVGGPDVRQVFRTVKSARAAEADLGAAGVIALVETNTGVPERLVDVAVRYWSSYPDEIDAWIRATEALEAEVLTAWERQQDLLAPRRRCCSTRSSAVRSPDICGLATSTPLLSLTMLR